MEIFIRTICRKKERLGIYIKVFRNEIIALEILVRKAHATLEERLKIIGQNLLRKKMEWQV